MTIKGLSGQSAIEYLMTYGWMLLIVTSAGGGIYSILGDQSIESVSGFDGQNIAVSNFALTTGGDLDFEINNRGSSKIRVKKLYLEDGSSSFSVPQHIQINPGETAIASIPGVGYSVRGTNRVDIEAIHDIGGLTNVSSSGAVAGKLDVEDSLLAKQNITDYMSLKDSFFKQKKIYDAKSNKSGHLRGNKTFENTARGPVLAFDGENNYIDVEQRSAINEEWSIAAWVKPRYLEETDSNAVINFRKDDNKCGVCFDIRRERAAVWAENFEIDGSTRWVYGNTELELNEWNLVGVTHGVDGETKIFVNDEIDSIGNKNNTVLRQDLENVRIGSGKGTGRYWDGQIANIIIYNKEITGSEIKELYQRTK